MLRRILFLCLLLLPFGFSIFGTETLEPTCTIMVPMRDGLELPTDLYLPSADAKHLPCILVRTPAGRRLHTDLFTPLVKEGYLVAIQDTRSVIDPEGRLFPYISDGWGAQRDGFDAVQWFANSEWTNGQVGTMGFSAMGITQLLMAPSAPPDLKCQYIGMAASNMYDQAIYYGGQVLKNQVEGWLGYHIKDCSHALNFLAQALYYNDFWHGLNTLAVVDKVNVPALHYGGWFDTFLKGTITSFVSRQENGDVGAKGKQKLVIGPWSHFWPHVQKLGDFDIPESGKIPPYDFSAKRWFDHYLLGKENGIDSLPPVLYYVMGPFDGSSSKGNVWRSAPSWPIPSTPTSLYLSRDQELASAILPDTTSQSYTYDPRDPVPTIGGRNLFLESGPKDQRPIESRDDVLVFTTEPLKEDLEVTGQINAEIYFISDREDTDIVVRLSDVYPDGKSILIADGIHRVCMSPKAQDRAGCQVQKVCVDLWSTSFVFAKGHQIRVSVTSSNFPRYEKNKNIGLGKNYIGPPLTAHNTLFLGGHYPSRIILPVVNSIPIVTCD
jgi:predicted acyl esterase